MTCCRFVPPYLLERVAALHPDDHAGGCSRQTLTVDGDIRRRRATASPAAGASPFGIHSAAHGTTLPGELVRAAGDPEVGDAAVDEAYVGVEGSLALFADAFGRASYDGNGAPVVATVHYGRDYDNAFWDGSQLVFGDGDGKVFDRFTKPVDVLGHEFTHGVVQHTAGFEYSGQPGALNESVADVFAACLKQRLLGQDAAAADWLIGEGIFLPSVNGRALRSMAEPGTAYDDPVVGRDPQVGSMDDYVQTSQDNGGVHINSGIPNRAFQRAAVRIGGPSWEVPGRVWYAALTSGIGPDTDFAGFAAATVQAADAVSDEVGAAVAEAWSEVGVPTSGAPAGSPSEPAPSEPAPSGPAASGSVVEVTRSGGIAGMRRTGAVELGADPRTDEVQQLVSRIDLRGVVGTRQQPDRYLYAFRISGEEVVVNEQDLTPDLHRLATLLLAE